MIKTVPGKTDQHFRRAARNALFNSSSWVVVLLINLAFTPYLVRHLTAEIFGLMVIMNGILGYLTLVDFSFRDALVKYVSEHLAVGATSEINVIFGAVTGFQLLLGCICSAVLLIFRHTVIGWFNIPPQLEGLAYVSYIIMAAGFPLSLLNGLYTSLPLALQRFDVAGIFAAVTGVMTALGAVVIVALGYSLPAIMSWNVLLLAASCLASHVWMCRTNPWWGYSPSLSSRVFRQLFSFSFFSQLAKSASMVNDQLIRIMLGTLLGPVAVTNYSVPFRLINGMQGLIDKVAKVTFPLASGLSATNDVEVLRRGYISASKYVCLLTTPIYFAMAVFSRDILTLWMGPHFADISWKVLSISAVAYWLVSWTMVPSNVAFGLGRAKINAAFATAVAAAGVVLTYLFATRWGIAGAAAAVLLTQVQTPLFVFLVSRHLGERCGGKTLREAYLAPAAAGVVVPIVGFAVLHAFPSAEARVFLGMPAAIVLYYLAATALRIISISELTRLLSVALGPRAQDPVAQ